MVAAEKSSTVIRDLERYFKVSNKLKGSGEPAAGIYSTTLQLALSSNVNNVLGSNEVENALVHQWLEYASMYSPYLNKSQTMSHQVLKELNGVLSRQSFLINNNRTVADIVLFYILWNIMSSLSFQEKEQYVSLSRWFNTLQQDDKLRQSRKLICFSRTLLYQ